MNKKSGQQCAWLANDLALGPFPCIIPPHSPQPAALAVPGMHALQWAEARMHPASGTNGKRGGSCPAIKAKPMWRLFRDAFGERPPASFGGACPFQPGRY